MIWLVGIFALVLLGLMLLRLLDWLAEDVEWRRLKATQSPVAEYFDDEMVAHLPEPAQRYFRYVIKPGTRLVKVAEIIMTGRLGLGSAEKPNFRNMKAQQILATPDGFVWRVRLRGLIPLSGSDSGRWTRFRMFGLIPVARLGGGADHTRSAYGRFIAESVFWTPAALLPRAGVAWEAVDENTARVTVTKGELAQAVDVKVDTDGKPFEVSFMRWSDANREKVYRLQPFGGVLSDFRLVDGYYLPFHVEAGNMFGTEAYFPFFDAEVDSIGFTAT